MRPLIALVLLWFSSICLAGDGIDSNTLAEARSLRIAAPNKWAVVIGASDYAELGTLKYARNDAKGFAEALTTDLLFKPKDVTLLIDRDRPDNAPTAKNIVAGLDKVFADKRLDKGDLFIFYFAGHGVGTKNGDFLCPTDATKTTIEKVGLPIREVTKRIIAAGLKNVLVICDACRAGDKNPFGAELQSLGRTANLAVLLGCAPGKRSYEYPELKHGAFTHFLLEGMKDESVRAQEGTLWASNLAQQVKAKVYAFTEPDHGKFAQEPATWNEKQADVFLAQFEPRTLLSLVTLKASLERAKEKGGNAYAQSLLLAAVFTLKEGLPTMAVDQLKILDSIGEMTPRSRLLYASTLRDLGRDFEANKQFGLLLALPVNDFFRLSAISGGQLNAFTTDQQLDAAIKLWQMDREFESAVWAWTLAGDAGVSRRESLLATLNRYYEPESRSGLYFSAIKSQLAGDQQTAIQRLSKALDTLGPLPVFHNSLMKLYEIAVESGNKSLEQQTIARGIKEDKDSIYFWLGIEARRLKEAKDFEAMMKLVRTGVSSRANPYEIYDYLDTAGSRSPELLPLLQKQLERHPFSWPIHAAIWIAQNAGDLDPNFKFSDEMKKFCSDPVELRLTVFKTLDRILNEKEKMDRFDSLMYNTKFFISLNQFNDQFGPDSSLWEYLQRWSENCGRTSQMARVAEARLYKLVYAGKCNQNLLATAMTIAMQEGDDANVDGIWKVASANGALKTDQAWRYLGYLVSRGRNGEAERLLPSMPKPTAMVGTKIGVLVRAYLDAAKGLDPSKIQATLDANEPEGIEDTYVWMLAAGLAGREERAAQFFTTQILSDDQYCQHMRAAGLRRMWEVAVREKKSEDLLALADITTSHFGNPLYAGITYLANPKIADYVGTLKFDAQFSDEGGHDRKGSGQMTITIRNDGTAEGKMDGLSFAGKVDKQGTLIANGLWDGEKLSIRAKLAPTSVYRSYQDKGDQPLEAFSAKFERILFMLKPTP